MKRGNMLKDVNYMLILNFNEIFRNDVHYDNIESRKKPQGFILPSEETFSEE